MFTVTIFAEHAPSETEFSALVAVLRDLGAGPSRVRVCMPLHGSTTGVLMDEIAAARGWSASRAVADMRRVPARWVDTDLHHLVASLRKAGLNAHGEYLSGSSVHKVRAAIQDDRADAVLLLTSRHRFTHLFRRDLEHRLRGDPSKVVDLVPRSH